MKRILIADDHHVVRNGLKHVLADEFSEIEFGEAQDSSEVLQKMKEGIWDIVILDINMPGRNGLDVLCQMKAENNKTPVLVLSMLAEDQIAVRVLKLGAFGYLSKDAPNEELIKAIHQILSGKRYITPSLAEQIAIQLENPLNKAQHEFLSEREYQTLILIARGKTVSHIADELSISTPTVSTYRARILEKMHMKNNADLMNYAFRNNLV